ncbi:hypothetical protein Mesop_3556 [Mesorhizobium opportunistum WSM2075]|uniref:Uncharacterized protein n=1 Tax=Mesorhizobium opportunistum (strain LMG 24607 / HAMBI 3007 / WSM2075) TaxID=536019 RepID=F7YFW7_MESOW|nr:hypothetical protein Mesop_3556 [Mesorhizobium opportunistum WSM2075]
MAWEIGIDFQRRKLLQPRLADNRLTTRVGLVQRPREERASVLEVDGHPAFAVQRAHVAKILADIGRDDRVALALENA